MDEYFIIKLAKIWRVELKYTYQKISREWVYDNNKHIIKNEVREIYKNLIDRDSYLSQHKNECFDRSKISSRREEWICKLSYKEHQYLNSILGNIIDYQVPLKISNVSKEINEGRGKIDLISKNDNTKTIYLIEVKVSNNRENPCKAILEIYTYYHLLGGKKNINIFLNKINCKGYKCKIALLFERNKDNNDEENYERRFKKNVGNVMKMTKDLGVLCYSFKENDYNIYSIKEVL